MKDQLRKELNNVRQSYVRVGYILRKMDENTALSLPLHPDG